MSDVVVLGLADQEQANTVRVPVRACADALIAGGASVELVTATSDSEIDAVLERVAAGARLVVASGADAQLRAVVRRMVRRWAPPPSRRPADLPAHRTIPDLPPVGILPLDPSGAPPPDDLAAQLQVARDPAAVAAAVLAGDYRRLDLLRHDGGSVTLDGALIGDTDPAGRAVPWRAVVEVDDSVLTQGDEPVLAVLVANAAGYARPDGLPLVTSADPADGAMEVAVAIPVRSRWRRRPRMEVRRARGRAAAVLPRADVACLDDGVAATLTRKRSWWIEPGAWAVYTR